jgi:hypothetical protein
MYGRVALEPDERLLFNAPAFAGGGFLGAGAMGGHAFVTNRRAIFLAVRFFGRSRVVRVSDMTSVTAQRKGIGWPSPKESVVIACDHNELVLRPW